MLRLVETDFTSAGKTDLCDRTPSSFLNVRKPDTLLSESRDLGLQIVTHEKEVVPVNLRRDEPPFLPEAARRSAIRGHRPQMQIRGHPGRRHDPPSHPCCI